MGVIIKRNTLLNNSGNSLIQVIVASGLMTIIAMSIFTLISDQTKQVKVLTEKMLVQEVARSITNIISDSNYCSCLFRGQTFNTITSTWSSGLTILPTSFTVVPAFPGPCTAAGTNIVGGTGTPLSGSTMTISSLDLSDITIITPGTGNYTAKVKIAFANSISSMRKITSSFNFVIDLTGGVATARPFISCGSVFVGGCRFCKDTCGGSWPVYGGKADTKDADWSGSVVMDAGCIGALTYHTAGEAYAAALCCAN